MQQLGFYLFRQLFAAFAFGTAAVIFVVLFTQSFHILSLVIDNASTSVIFFQLMALMVPTILPLVLPLGLGVSVLFVYNKLAVDSELVVMRAAGVSPMRLAKPTIILAGLVLIICYILTLWLTPLANRNLVALQYQVRDGYAVFLAHPGSFNDITDGLTFYARRRGSNGQLEGILIHDVRKPDAPVTIMADTGQVIDNHAQPQIVVFNGRRQEMDPATGRLSELAFDQYTLDLNELRNASSERMPDLREQTIGQLFNPSIELLNTRITKKGLLAEIHQRLALPFLAFSYALVALAAILAGEFNRRGMSRRLLLAGFSIITIEAIFMSLNSLVTRHLWMVVALYTIAILPSLIGLIFINIERLQRASLPPLVAPSVEVKA